MAKPLGSLGLLEDAVMDLCAIQGTLTPDIAKRAVVMFCADNGVVAQGVTQTGSEVTAIVAGNVCKGDTSVCNMSKIAHADVFPVDMGMITTVDHPRMRNCRIAAGTKDFSQEWAMTREQAVQGLETGIALAGELKAQGYGLLATGEMGIGNTTTSSAVASVLLERPPGGDDRPPARACPELVCSIKSRSSRTPLPSTGPTRTTPWTFWPRWAALISPVWRACASARQSTISPVFWTALSLPFRP